MWLKKKSDLEKAFEEEMSYFENATKEEKKLTKTLLKKLYKRTTIKGGIVRHSGE